MKKKGIITAFITTLLCIGISAQEEETFKPTFNWKGFANVWTGYSQRDTLDGQYGFAVRYLRFKATGKLAPKVSWTGQFAFDRGNPTLLDLHLTYEPFEFFKVRAGQFPVPGAKSAVHSSPLWSTTKMIINDRSTITQNWNSNAGLSGYRSGGAMVFGSIIDKKLHYFVMMAMPQAGPSYYFNTSVKNPEASKDANGVATFTRLEFRPIKEIELGANFHAGKGSTEDIVGDTVVNKEVVIRRSYSVYYLMRLNGINIMAEYIAGKNQTDFNDVSKGDLKYNGFYLEGGYRFDNNLMPVVRYSSYTPNNNNADGNGYKKYDNITLGLNYYPTKNIALMLNYVLRLEAPDNFHKSIKNDIIYFQLRFLFPTNK